MPHSQREARVCEVGLPWPRLDEGAKPGQPHPGGLEIAEWHPALQSPARAQHSGQRLGRLGLGAHRA